MSSSVPVGLLVGWMLLLTVKHVIADFLLQNAWPTLIESVAGFLLGNGIAIALAIIFVHNRTLDAVPESAGEVEKLARRLGFDTGERFLAQLQEHRGQLILVLGILSFFVGGPILGLVAWIMGSNDLKEMRAGRMDLKPKLAPC